MIVSRCGESVWEDELAGLKIRWGNTRVGSIPTFGISDLRRSPAVGKCLPFSD